jgi:hypothetical protein
MKYWREALWADLAPIADNMREADKEEVAALGYNPLFCLSYSLECSNIAYTLIAPDGTPAGMLGVVTQPDGWGKVWLLGTDLITQHQRIFLKHCKPVLAHLYEDHPVLFNYVYKNNPVHIKWLRWLGFKIIREVRINDSAFYEFAGLRT